MCSKFCALNYCILVFHVILIAKRFVPDTTWETFYVKSIPAV